MNMKNAGVGQEATELPLFMPGVVRPGQGQEPPQLLGGQCPSCGKMFFPRQYLCPVCLVETHQAAVGSRGAIYAFTHIRTKPPLGLPEPYGVAYVDLDDNHLRIFGLLDPRVVDRFAIGQRVRLEVGPIGLNLQGAPCLRPYFTPDSPAVVRGEGRDV
jgi:uncharacterized OB-fold protein